MPNYCLDCGNRTYEKTVESGRQIFACAECSREYHLNDLVEKLIEIFYQSPGVNGRDIHNIVFRIEMYYMNKFGERFSHAEFHSHFSGMYSPDVDKCLEWMEDEYAYSKCFVSRIGGKRTKRKLRRGRARNNDLGETVLYKSEHEGERFRGKQG